MASVSGFGATGPEQHYVAYGANIEASSGLASVMGYRDEEQPYRAGTFYADPIAANYLVLAILAAVRSRRASGLGQWIDLSLNEAAAGFFGGYFVGYQRCGELEPHYGNRHQVHAPQGVYGTIGQDAWVAVCVRTEEEWRALATVVERPEWSIEPQFQTAAGRQTCHDEIDEAIAAWAATRDHNEAARELQAAGVPAAPVMANWEMLSDLHLDERGFYVRIRHPEVGALPFPGMAWKFSKTPGQVRRPAPLFAEHNRLVYEEILGLDPARVKELEKSGIAGTHPDAAFYRAAPRIL
jgi:crotonobetainyl-CoA:carnitine CoA-transferase CaiB-like acyl-CoA transferase